VSESPYLDHGDRVCAGFPSAPQQPPAELRQQGLTAAQRLPSLKATSSLT